MIGDRLFASTASSSIMARMRTLARGLANYRMQGPKRTVLDALIYLLQYHPETDQSFDREHGTDTGGRVSPRQIVFPNAEAARSAMVYVASPAPVTSWLLNRLDIDHREFSFVDIGAGKGRVLLVASELGFREIIGVEISQELCDTAIHNAAIYGQQAANIQVRCADAAATEFPAGPTVFHLYHPFDETMLDRVLANIHRTHVASPSRRLIAYLLPSGVEHRVCATFSNHSFLKPVAYHRSLAGEYDLAIYEAG